MTRKPGMLVTLAIAVAVLAVFLTARPQAADKVTDPVCGMSLSKTAAKATVEYKGTTYYFCSESCRDKFVKDPDRYVKAEAAAAEAKPESQAPAEATGSGQGASMKTSGCQMAAEGAMGQAKTPRAASCAMEVRDAQTGPEISGRAPAVECPLGTDGVTWTVENTADGAIIRLASSNPETVKAIQAHLAMMKDAKGTGTGSENVTKASAPCGRTCPMKKTTKGS
jgi:YHS domain-containing protein